MRASFDERLWKQKFQNGHQQLHESSNAAEERQGERRGEREREKETESVGNPRVEAFSRAEITGTYIMQCFFYGSTTQSPGVLSENGPMGSRASGFSRRALLQYIRISSDFLAQATLKGGERFAVNTELCHL